MNDMNPAERKRLKTRIAKALLKHRVASWDHLTDDERKRCSDWDHLGYEQNVYLEQAEVALTVVENKLVSQAAFDCIM